MSLDITDVRVTRLKNPKSKIVGFATLTFNEVLVVEDWKIINGSNGLFVTGPSKKVEGQDNPYRDIVKLITRDSNQSMQRAVIAAYEGNGGAPAQASGGSAKSGVRAQYGEYMDSDVPPPGDGDNPHMEEEESDGPNWFND